MSDQQEEQLQFLPDWLVAALWVAALGLSSAAMLYHEANYCLEHAAVRP